MKISKCLALLSLMLMMHMQTAAQDCKPTDCVKKSTTAELNQEAQDVASMAVMTSATVQATADCSKVCDPADCPPECRILCKAICNKSASMVEAKAVPKANDLVMLLPERPIPVLSPPGLDLNRY